MRLSGLIKVSAVILCCAATSRIASGQQTTRSQNDPRPVAHAVKRTGNVVIDGKLDDAAWAAATPIGDLVQAVPNEGRAPAEKTEIRILYDEAAIYIGARMYDSEGAKGVRAVLTRRDNFLNGTNLTTDKIAFVFDPFRDKNSRDWFELNPLGVKGDHKDGDTSYDPVWEGASHIDSLGWTAEFRIPFSQIRFSRDPNQLWGMQVWRYTDRLNEQDMWAFWRSNEYGGPAYFGTLDGITVGSQPRQVELVPYATSRATMARVASSDPYHSDRQGQYRIGGDAKLNVTSNLTLDATVNPDFGQVEVDPASVNLSVFETTFAEKRPLFVSNSQYFSTGGFSCYFCDNVSSLSLIYTRRIGRSPQLAGLVGSRAQFMDASDATAILGAGKVTGRTASGWTVGLLDAVTNREEAKFRLEGETTDQTEEVEPLTNYFIGRLRKDFNGGATRIGAISTLVNRSLTNPDEVQQLRARAGTFGLDLDHHWSERAYSLNIQTALTNIGGDTAAINRAQLSSARYYNRLGRGETTDGLFSTSYDPTRTNLNGYGFYTRLAKETGNWLWEGIENWRSPGFEANDLGVLSRSDYKWQVANVVRQWTTPASFYRNLWLSAGAQNQRNYEGDETDVDYHVYAQTTFRNYWNFNIMNIYHPSYWDERLTRGGPTELHYGYKLVGVNFGSDSRKRVVYGINYNNSTPVDNSEGGRQSYSPYVTLKPSSSMDLTLSPTYDHDLTAQQFVTSFGDPFAPAGFGNTRYVFGKIEQKTFSMDTRLNTTFTPNLTLELYAQPFLASGHYSSFKEFAKPHSGQMTYYGRDNGSTITSTTTAADGTTYKVDPDGNGPAAPFTLSNPDFNFRSLRGTAVVRYEYRPGSTLFFVWTQERDGSSDFGDFNISRDRAALFRDRPTNIFQIKATYWLGR
jgi:hypothetical protein